MLQSFPDALFHNTQKQKIFWNWYVSLGVHSWVLWNPEEVELPGLYHDSLFSFLVARDPTNSYNHVSDITFLLRAPTASAPIPSSLRLRTASLRRLTALQASCALPSQPSSCSCSTRPSPTSRLSRLSAAPSPPISIASSFLLPVFHPFFLFCSPASFLPGPSLPPTYPCDLLFVLHCCCCCSGGERKQ